MKLAEEPGLDDRRYGVPTSSRRSNRQSVLLHLVAYFAGSQPRVSQRTPGVPVPLPQHNRRRTLTVHEFGVLVFAAMPQRVQSTNVIRRVGYLRVRFVVSHHPGKLSGQLSVPVVGSRHFVQLLVLIPPCDVSVEPGDDPLIGFHLRVRQTIQAALGVFHHRLGLL